MIDLIQDHRSFHDLSRAEAQEPAGGLVLAVCRTVGNIRRMEDAGAAAVVLHSLFEEQIDLESDELDRFIAEGAEASAEVHRQLFPRPDATE